MPNLQWQCPKCKSDNLDVSIVTWAKLTQDEDGENFETDTEESHDYSHEFDEESMMLCNDCGHMDASISFQVEPEGEEDDDGDADTGPVEFSESPAGDLAREKWVQRYDELNGAPEGDNDR